MALEDNERATKIRPCLGDFGLGIDPGVVPVLLDQVLIGVDQPAGRGVIESPRHRVRPGTARPCGGAR